MPSSRPDVPPAERFLLRNLNLYGLDHLDPVILAALADERPLLLIGAHGTAKSELLNRLAAALQLEHRHFNASLISFDDLLGYPVPNAERDGLTWLRTPGDLWAAESVFLDEISRCRPETQNTSFSSEDGWRGACASRRRDRRLRLLQALVRHRRSPEVACRELADPQWCSLAIRTLFLCR